MAKKKYAIIYRGNRVGESWAVSADKTITNYWWRTDKRSNQFTKTSRSKTDYDAVEL